MKRSFLILFSCFYFGICYCQVPVTTFLGIPVDGYKSDMIQKLKAKGFQYNAYDDYLSGEFNGYPVDIYVVTNNNKVYRIVVIDKYYMSAEDIKLKFNMLCSQLDCNKKYIKSGIDNPNYSISSKEDIFQEISVNKKRYEAFYYQITKKVDYYQEKINEKTKTFYGENAKFEQLTADKQKRIICIVNAYLHNTYSDNSVWFMIDQEYSTFGIIMYYDNDRNKANGEDL